MVSFWAALAGGLLSGVITGGVSYLAVRHAQIERRQARQWEDAEVVADVYRLLVEIDPARRAANVRTEDDVENARWADIGRRLEDIRAELVRLSTGHPSADVQAAADRLGPELSKAAAYSRNLVSDVLRARNTPEQLQEAEDGHAEARSALEDLKRAVKSAGRGGRTRRHLGGSPARAINQAPGQP
jgi:hypothetical protein